MSSRLLLPCQAAVLVIAIISGASEPPKNRVVVERKSGVRYRLIPAGRFMMGCLPTDNACADDENPRHQVRITRPFLMAETETTNEQYRRCVSAGACRTPADPSLFHDNIAPTPDAKHSASRRDHPVVNVTWHDAATFCGWAGGRLPTEAEWEYAARGGQPDRIYSWGNVASRERANYGKEVCCGGQVAGKDRWELTAPAGSFPANGFGLFDMAGNVWEWVDDWFGAYPSTASVPLTARSQRVLRGGSWYVHAAWLRSSDRGGSRPLVHARDYGFRCAGDDARSDSP